MEFFAYPQNYVTFTQMLNWFMDMTLNTVALVFVLNAIFSTILRVCKRISHGGGRCL